MPTDSDHFHAELSQALQRLVSVRRAGEGAMVSVPVAYPSGATTSLSISLAGDHCFVSDCSLGLQEAEMAGASDFYDFSARKSAEWFGVAYDGASLFSAAARLDRIDGALIAVANASAGAVSRAIARAAEAKDSNRNSLVFEIVTKIFGRSRVEKRREMAGRDAKWDAHNVVDTNGCLAVFEFVNTSPSAIASKFQMFSDLVRAEEPPALISVVESISMLGPKGAMLCDVSNVIEISADTLVFEKLAKAA